MASIGLRGALLASAMLFPAHVVLAQSADTTASLDSQNEIIVTATKRSERLLDVPLAVTALTGTQLADAQVYGIDTLAQQVPSLTFTQSTNDLNNNVRIRGIGTALFNTGLESSVSFVLDGVVLSRQGQGFQDLIDIERVEVLRGPQGLLFGKNAIAGVINIVTKRPAKEFGIEAEAIVGELDEYRVRSSLTGPIADNLAFRLTGFWNDVGGHIENVETGRMVNGAQSHGLRGQLEWDPTSTLNLRLIGDWRQSEAECCQFQARSFANPVATALLNPVVPSPTNRQVRTDGATFNNTDQWGVSLEANLALGNHQLTSITAYRTWDFENSIDVDGFAGPPRFTLPLVPTAIGQFNLNGGPTNIRQFSQELRLASPDGDRFNYVAGLFYFHLDLDRGFQRRVGLCLPGGANGPVVPGAACAAPQTRSTFHTANTTTDHIAAFGRASYEITDELSVIGGFRLQNEKVSYVGNRPGTALAAGELPLLGPNSGSGSLSDTDFSVQAGLQYQPSSNIQAYATFTQGYKGAGFDVEVSANFAGQQPVLPETVNAYEIGFKAQTNDGKASVNIAAFYQDYTNLQVQATQQVDGLNQFVPTNAGASVSKGVEIEFSVRPNRNWSLFGGYTYLDATLNTDGTNCTVGAVAQIIPVGADQPFNQCFRVQGEAANLNRLNIRNGVLPNAPEHRLSLTGRYEAGLSSKVVAFIQSTVLMQSEILFALDQDLATRQPSYVTTDLVAGLRDPGRRWQASLFVRNLFDVDYTTSIFRDALFATAASPDNLSHYIPREAQRLVAASLRFSF